jgi:hypothetical protein
MVVKRYNVELIRESRRDDLMPEVILPTIKLISENLTVGAEIDVGAWPSP